MHKVLIVDDSTPMRTLIQLGLKSIQEIEIFQAMNGMNAEEFLRSTPDCDLLITDIVMPGMSGWELIERVRKTHGFEHLPILVLTSDAVFKDSEIFIRSGANDILVKPFHSGVLRRTVRKLLCIE